MRRHFRNRQHRKQQAAATAAAANPPPQDFSAMAAANNVLSAQAVASLPPPGLSGPSQPVWSPAGSSSSRSSYLAFVSSSVQTIRQVTSPPALYKPLTTPAPPSSVAHNSDTSAKAASTAMTVTTTERTLMVLDMDDVSLTPRPLLRFDETTTSGSSSCSNKRSLEQPAGVEESLEEKLRRERQRLGSGSSLTQFDWAWADDDDDDDDEQTLLRVLVPVRGSLYIQDGVAGTSSARCLHDKSMAGNAAAVDAQLSPDASLVAWTTADGEIYAKSATAAPADPAIRISYGAVKTDTVCISHGVADFVAQEEMDRYSGLWWSPTSDALLFARVDESMVPLFRIVHYPSQNNQGLPLSYSSNNAAPVQFEDHRYPFAGKKNPVVRLGCVKIDRPSMIHATETPHATNGDGFIQNGLQQVTTAAEMAARHWNSVIWFDAPREASEYLARVHWLPDGKTVVTQWQNRAQNVSILYRMDVHTGKGHTLLVERSELWINLHHMFCILERPIHPDECTDLEAPRLPISHPMPAGCFSFLFASERTGYAHLYLYTYVPYVNGDQAILLRAVSAGDWMVEHIAGVDILRDTVYLTGTFDSPLERHLYAVPLTNRPRYNDTEHDDNDDAMDDDYSFSGSSNGVRKSINKVMNVLSGKSKHASTMRGSEKSWLTQPVRLTLEGGMHSVIMDRCCRYFVDTNSDLDRPSTTVLYELPRQRIDFMAIDPQQNAVVSVKILFDADEDDKSLSLLVASNGKTPPRIPQQMKSFLPPPDIFSFPTADGSETLYAALYRPDATIHGSGPYPLVNIVYGGPHVQRVNRSWTQCADMRAQRLCNLGFCVIKCDNRGSSRRGLAFESAIAKGLGRVEVLDQVAAVQQAIVRGVADSSRVGIYGWSYGGYLAAMCLFRAPDVFHVAVAGAPVTSWDGYDTHYTERYMGLPSENLSGYQESAVFDHVPNMRGKILIVHGLIDENVHFRHSSRLINKLTNAGKDYDLLVFPDERHSPRRLRDRVYMEQRISDFFVRNLSSTTASQVDIVDVLSTRQMVGRL